MRVFQTHFTDSKGNSQKCKTWYIEFHDHQGRKKKIAGDKKQDIASYYGQQIETLVNLRKRDRDPDPELQDWIMKSCPDKLRQKLIKLDILKIKQISTAEGLSKHIDSFKNHLRAKGNTEFYAEQTHKRITTLCEGCGFQSWDDIEPEDIEAFMTVQRDKGQSTKTVNYYLQSFKQFCKWMIQYKRIARYSLADCVPPIKNTEESKRKRRALKIEEQRKLLKKTRKEPERFGMTGPQRALLYRVALETGLRSGELRALQVDWIDFKSRTIYLPAGATKNKKSASMPIRSSLALALKSQTAKKLPGASVFGLPCRFSIARMLKKDEEAAGIEYKDKQSRYADMHALRHTFITTAGRTTLTTKEHQDLARHSTPALTIGQYSHAELDEKRKAIERMPDLTETRKGKTA